MISFTSLQEQLIHDATAVMMGMHDVFQENELDKNNHLLVKKLCKHDGAWDTQKDILGFQFNGAPQHKMLWLADKNDTFC